MIFGKPNLVLQNDWGAVFVLQTRRCKMARPAAKDLTDRELEVMHVFWKKGELTAQDARNHLAEAGRDLSYPTVANLVRALYERGFLESLNNERPICYRPIKS